MAGRRKAKRMAPGKITGVEEYLFQGKRTEPFHGGQRPVGGALSLSRGGMIYRRSKAFPQIGQSKVSFGKVGDGRGRFSGRGEWVSVSRSSRRAARSRR